MTRKTTTVMLESTECAAGSAHTVEKALLSVPGVSRAYVNPVTEAAYVEYDADRCSEADLDGAVESVGIHTLHSAARRAPAVIRFPFSSERLAMPNTSTRSQSRSWWAFAGFIAIAGFFLFTEHRAHLFGILPFLFVLACPLLHIFHHGGHGGHGGDAQTGDDEHAGHSNQRAADRQASDSHQHLSSVTRADWRS